MDSLGQSPVEGQLNCPVHKRRNSFACAGDKSCLREGASSQSIEFSLASAETKCCFGFRSADLCGFPSNSSSNCIRKSAFLWSGWRLSAMLWSLMNLSWVSFFNSFSLQSNWKFRLNWGLHGFSFLHSLYSRCCSIFDLFAQGSPRPNMFSSSLFTFKALQISWTLRHLYSQSNGFFYFYFCFYTNQP